MEILRVLKANPYHDEKGRFTTGGNAKSVSSWVDFGSPAGLKKKLSTPEGRREVFTNELTEIAGNFHKLGYPKKQIHVTELAESWERHIGDKLTPKQFMRGMLGDKHPYDNDRVKLGFSGSKLEFSMGGGTFHGAEVDYVSRSMNFTSKDAHHGYVELKSESTGAGAIKSFFRNAVPMYKKAGMESISLQANLDIGGYAWARYGFKADTPYDGLKHAKRARGYSRDAKVQKYLDQLIDRGERDGEFAKDIPRFVAVIKEISRTGRPLGKAAMLGTSWDAHLKLTDAAALRRLERYVRQKKKT